MKNIIILIFTAVLHFTNLSAQNPEDNDMRLLQMVFMYANSYDNNNITEHKNYSDSLIISGKIILAGFVNDTSRLRQILVFDSDSLEEIKSVVDEFPSVKAGVFKPKILTWFAARNIIKEPVKPLEMEKYIFGILERDSRWTPEQTPEVMKLQEGHMANINRLAEIGKLVLAGPFEIGGNQRGVFIFKVNTIEEAQELTNTDPAVKAGRLKIVLYPWQVYKGILP